MNAFRDTLRIMETEFEPVGEAGKPGHTIPAVVRVTGTAF
jgi:hypothetical protein